jgi:hypothetical protein
MEGPSWDGKDCRVFGIDDLGTSTPPKIEQPYKILSSFRKFV